MIDGTFALAAMHIDHPDMMIVARNASPLALALVMDLGLWALMPLRLHI